MTINEHIASHAKNYPPLTNEEEKELSVLCLAGDMDARDKLVNHNMLYALKIAGRWWRSPEYKTHREDLEQAAVMGLLSATETYDGRIRFAVWARYYMMIEFNKVCDNILCGHSLPKRLSGSFNSVKKVYYEFKATHGHEPTEEELLEVLSLGGSRVSIVNASLHVLQKGRRSLDASIGDDDGGMLHDIVANDEESPEELSDTNTVKGLIEKALSLLTEKEAYVLKSVFGMGINEPVPTCEIEKELGVTHQRVSQIKLHALSKLAGTCDSPKYDPEEFRFFFEGDLVDHEMS